MTKRNKILRTIFRATAILALTSMINMKYINASYGVNNNIDNINPTLQKEEKSPYKLKKIIESQNTNKYNFKFTGSINNFSDSEIKDIKKNTVKFFNAFNAAFNCYDYSVKGETSEKESAILREMCNKYLEKAYKILDDKWGMIDFNAVISIDYEELTIIAKIFDSFLYNIDNMYLFSDTTILDKLLDHKILINSNTIVDIAFQLDDFSIRYEDFEEDFEANKAHLDKMEDYFKKFVKNSSSITVPSILIDKNNNIDKIFPSLSSEVETIIKEKILQFDEKINEFDNGNIFFDTLIFHINSNNLPALQELFKTYGDFYIDQLNQYFNKQFIDQFNEKLIEQFNEESNKKFNNELIEKCINKLIEKFINQISFKAYDNNIQDFYKMIYFLTLNNFKSIGDKLKAQHSKLIENFIKEKTDQDIYNTMQGIYSKLQKEFIGQRNDIKNTLYNAFIPIQKEFLGENKNQYKYIDNILKLLPGFIEKEEHKNITNALTQLPEFIENFIKENEDKDIENTLKLLPEFIQNFIEENKDINNILQKLPEFVKENRKKDIEYMLKLLSIFETTEKEKENIENMLKQLPESIENFIKESKDTDTDTENTLKLLPNFIRKFINKNKNKDIKDILKQLPEFIRNFIEESNITEPVKRKRNSVNENYDEQSHKKNRPNN